MSSTQEAKPTDSAYVVMTNELVEMLSNGEWSNPVRVRIVKAEGLRLTLDVTAYVADGMLPDFTARLSPKQETPDRE